MELQLDVQPLDDMTPGEVAALTAALRNALEGMAEVDEVKSVPGAATDGSKGLLSVLGALMVNLPAGALTGMLDIIKAIASRPGHPPVTIKVSAGGIEGSFDPKTVTPEQFAALAASLSRDLRPA